MRRILTLLVGLLMIITFVRYTDGDIMVITIAYVVDNNMVIDIQVEDGSVTLKVDQSFTFISDRDGHCQIFLYGEDADVVSAVSRLPVGGKFDCNEGYIGIYNLEVKKGETAFDYSYEVFIQDIDGVEFHRSISSWIPGFNSHVQEISWTHYQTSFLDQSLTIRSNVNLSASDLIGNRIDSSDDGRDGNGTEIVYRWKSSGLPEDDIMGMGTGYEEECLNIKWGNGMNNSFMREKLLFHLREENIRDVENLIVKENVDIDVRLADPYPVYDLHAEFRLNRRVIDKLESVVVWFPENGTNCNAVYRWEYPSFEGAHGFEVGEVNITGRPKERNGQRGFYIHIPEYHNGSVIELISDPYLYVDINGTISRNCFNFIIVTVPMEDSRIEIEVPATFDVIVMDSPFEKQKVFQTFQRNTITFQGECESKGPLHLEWNILSDRDMDGCPDKYDFLPDDPLEWSDYDGDGWGDHYDAYPHNPRRWILDAEGNIGDHSAIDSDEDESAGENTTDQEDGNVSGIWPWSSMDRIGEKAKVPVIFIILILLMVFSFLSRKSRKKTSAN